jgi:hypothetical protein
MSTPLIATTEALPRATARNVSMLGGALLLTRVGAGHSSLDARRARRATAEPSGPRTASLDAAPSGDRGRS